MNWKIDVWDKRLKPQKELTLEVLIRLNGFDGPASNLTVVEWNKMIDYHLGKLNISNGQKVLEIGCGAGAFIGSYKNKFKLDIYGYDYSEALISIAKTFFNDCTFCVSEATKNPFYTNNFDLCYFHSMSQYFDSEDYFIEVIRTMNNSIVYGGRIGLFDIIDTDSYYEYLKSREEMSQDYKMKYTNLTHFSISKDRVREILNDFGFTNIDIYMKTFDGYLNSKFRFSVVARKA